MGFGDFWAMRFDGWCFCVGLCNIDSNAFGLVVGFAWLGFCWWCLVFVMCVDLWVAV